ncbi:ribonuclease H-like domain-containing protein [Mucidula mucida]|nr:ribonuclease H-like domain-containing protein [Mucidula mucida]
METDDKPVEVYIDGSRSNRKKAGIGIWWGTNDKRNVSAHSQQRVCHSDATEFEALIVLLERIGANKVSNAPAGSSSSRNLRHFIVRTDSVNVITGVTVFIPAYREQSWKYCKSSHIEILRYLDVLLSNAQHRKIEITLKYVPGHSGNAGNTGADRLAKAGARLSKTFARDWTAERLKLSARIAAADLPAKAALTSRKRKRQELEQEEEEEEESEEEESTSEDEESSNEDEESEEEHDDEEGAEDVGSEDDSDLEDDGDDYDSESSEEGLDAQPSTKKHASEDETSDDEEDSDDEDAENEEDVQDSESGDESDTDDDNSESSEDDSDVQSATKKRKLNTGVASVPCEEIVLSKRALKKRRWIAKVEEIKRLKAFRSAAAKDQSKLSSVIRDKEADVDVKISWTRKMRRNKNYRRNVKARRAAAAQSIKSD